MGPRNAAESLRLKERAEPRLPRQVPNRFGPVGHTEMPIADEDFGSGGGWRLLRW